MNSIRLACSLVLSATAVAFAAPGGDKVREGEQRQLQISTDTKALSAALDMMLGEYERNFLAGDDAATVQALRGQLDKLGADEMRSVVDLLQQARATQNPGASAKTVADAVSAQRRIVTELSRILAAHTRTTQSAEIARQLNDLADRQARNLRDGITLARITKWSNGANLETLKQAQMETQRGEQAAIAKELGIAREKLRKLADDPHSGESAVALKKADEQIKAIEGTAEKAAETLRQGQLREALTDEISARDELRKIARTLAPRERGAEALRKAGRELAELSEDQAKVMQSTTRHTVQPDFEKWLAEKAASKDPAKALDKKFHGKPLNELTLDAELRAKFEQEREQNGAVLGRLDDQQGELAQKGDFIGQDLADLPKVAADIKQAVGEMQEARNALRELNAPEAAKQQAEAAAKIAAAQQELARRADEAELIASRSGDKSADLEKLKSAVENLANEEAAAATKPDAAQQADIARRAEKMTARAAELAPAAAEAMKAAAADARQSEAAKVAGNDPAAAAEAGEAAKNLAKAAEQIAQELAKTATAKEQAKEMQAVVAELAKIIQSEQQIDLEAAKATALGSKRMAEELQRLAKEQAATQEKTEAFKNSLTAAQLAASQALGDAMADMGAARAELEAGNSKPAREAAQQAIEKLMAAQRSIGTQMLAAQQAAGQQLPMDAAEMAKLANQVQQALQNVDLAEGNLQQAAEALGQKAAQNAAEAAQMAAEAARQAAQAAQAAQQEAAQAANAPAGEQAKMAAQQAAAAAQAAMAAAQAAQQLANLPPDLAKLAQQVAEQAAQAAQAAQQAGQAAQQAQQSAQQAAAAPSTAEAARLDNQQAAAQAAQAAQAAAQAAKAAQQAQQMAQAAGAAAQSGSPQAQQSMQQASQQLSQAAMAAAAAAANGQLPPEIAQAAQQAAQQLAQASGQAMAGQNAPAQQATQQAAEQLAQAAQQMGAQMAGLAQQGGQAKGQNQGQAGEGMKGEGRQPGRGQGGKEPQQPSTQPSEGAEEYKPGGDPTAVQRAARQAALKKADFIGLPAREREALRQSLGEKYPSEYGAMVEQYLLNLASEAAKKK